MKKIYAVAITIMLLGIVLLTGCVNQYSSGDAVGNNPFDEGKEIEEKEEESKPSEDILFTKGSDGKIVFKVNDTKYGNFSGQR